MSCLPTCTKDNLLAAPEQPESATGAEILNINYHTRILVLTALDRYHTIEAAAQKMGITPRTLYNYKQAFGISRSDLTGRYELFWKNTPSFRLELVAPLQTLPRNNFWADCLRGLAENALKLSEAQFLLRIREIQDQIRSCPDTMKCLLGDHLIIFKLLNARA